MTSEDRKRFKAKLKDIALSSDKLLNDNCKYENNLSSEELSSYKTLIRKKNIAIQKADKDITVVIIDKEKYIQGLKNIISNSSQFIPSNIQPDDYTNYIVNVEKKFRKFLITYMTIIKSVKISFSKFALQALDQESYTAIQRFTNPFLIICLNLDQFFLLLTLLDMILQNF